MKFKRGLYVRGLVAGLVFGTAMLSGTSFAQAATPEIDPAMATGGLAILGLGVALLIERYRARK